MDIGGRRELFVDGRLIVQLQGARLKLHPPQPREIVLKFDRPWEGLYSGYETILHTGDVFRLYYRGLPVARHTLDTEVTCVAESRDGVSWAKPELGLFEVQGTKENNVVLARHRACHNFAPFLDANPHAPADQQYKALGGSGAPGLIAFVSPDGIHWQELQKEPVITQGAFDSQNNAFWSQSEGQYVCYFRVFREGIRWIARSTSKDFVQWTEPVDLELDGKPRQHLYTNQMAPYLRAPHIYLGLPTRFMPGRRVVTEQEARKIGTPTEWDYANDCTDVLLCSARGGAELKRTFLEAFVRPGLDLRNWTSRANYAARGIVETADEELSLYVKHNAGYPTAHVRRYTLRPDGFVSVNGPYNGGEMTTRPLLFSGSRLSINYATSAAGSLQVELQTPSRQAIDGFTLADCPEIVGDRIEGTVRWTGGESVGQLAGKPVRLRFVLRDADLYSIQFLP
ncbi:MAG: hypothetical protein JXB62_05490 [Pirellulales bacterium]|nr:hypothetical protein [Pirellulales bacterium]